MVGLRSVWQRFFGLPELPLAPGERLVREDIVDVLAPPDRPRAVATLTTERWVVRPFGSVYSFPSGALELEVRRTEVASIEQVGRTAGTLRGGFPAKPGVRVRLADGSSYHICSWQARELSGALDYWRQAAPAADSVAEGSVLGPRPVRRSHGPRPQLVDRTIWLMLPLATVALLLVGGPWWIVVAPAVVWGVSGPFALSRYGRWRIRRCPRKRT